MIIYNTLLLQNTEKEILNIISFLLLDDISVFQKKKNEILFFEFYVNKKLLN